MEKRKKISLLLCRMGILLFAHYCLITPLQVLFLRSLNAGIAILLFGLGLLLHPAYLKEHWKRLFLQADCSVVLALAVTFMMDRGGTNKKSTLVLCGFFAISPIMLAYLKDSGDEKLKKRLGRFLTVALTVCSLVCTYWNARGFLEGRTYGAAVVYSRIVSSGLADQMTVAGMKFWGIQGYDYLYALLIALPFFIAAAEKKHGVQKCLAVLFILLQYVTILLSQYMIAIGLATLIFEIVIVAKLAGKFSRGRIRLGQGMGIGLLPILLCLVLAKPLLTLAGNVAVQLHLGELGENLQSVVSGMEGGLSAVFANLHDIYLEMLNNPPPETLEDGTWNDIGRLRLYMKSIVGFTQSPLTGSLFGGTVRNGLHSDWLDALSTGGILGFGALGFSLVALARPCFKRLKGLHCMPYIVLSLACLAFVMLVNPILTSCPVSLLLMSGVYYATEAEKAEALPEEN